MPAGRWRRSAIWGSKRLNRLHHIVRSETIGVFRRSHEREGSHYDVVR
jgi:hypothetical protein